jgi:hypothetical protein
VTVHDVRVTRGTCLWTLLEPRLQPDGSVAVNSRHHQSVKQPGTGFVVSAVSPDGIVEAIEKPGAALLRGRAVASENFRTAVSSRRCLEVGGCGEKADGKIVR